MAPEASDYRSQWRQRRYLRARRRLLIGVGIAVVIVAVILLLHWRGGTGPVWRYQFTPKSAVYFTADHEAVFCALPARRALALDAVIGNAMWRQPFVASRALAVPPCLTESAAIYVTDSGAVIALDRKTGQSIWQQNTDSSIRCKPMTHNGCVYVGTDNGNVYSFDLEDGRQRWRTSVGAPVNSGFAVIDDIVVSATIGGKIFALNTDTGRPGAWEQTVIGLPIVAAPAIIGDRVVFGTSAGRGYLVNPASGEITRYMDMPTYGLITSPPLTDDNRLYFASNDGWIVAWEKNSPDAWRQRWRSHIGETITTNLAMDREHLYCGTGNRCLNAVTRSTGRIARRWECGGVPSGSVNVSRDNIVVGTRAGEVIAFQRPVR